MLCQSKVTSALVDEINVVIRDKTLFILYFSCFRNF